MPTEKCLSDTELLSLIENRADETLLHRVEHHLDECPACRRVLSQVVDDDHASPPIPDKPSAVLSSGTVVGRYVIKELLGIGGMGVVYAAYDPELERLVALKLLRSPPVGKPQADSQELMREARAMARLSNRHVVTVYDVGTIGSQLFLVMELIQGQTLREWASLRLPLRDRIDVMIQAGQGLLAAHDGGLHHGDFKPENVLISRDGVPRVSDFGVAHHASWYWEQEFGGTPNYLAPECAAGAPPSALSDQFSFCVTLYEVICGTLPGAPAPREVPPWLLRVFRRGLSPEPAARFASMRELLAVLDAENRRPSRLRRWAPVFAGLLVIALATSALFKTSGSSCNEGEERLARVWNAQRREQLRAAFLATKVEDADAFWRAFESRLDFFSTDWLHQYHETCEVAQVPAEVPQRLHELRMLCLNDRLREASVLLTYLESADAQRVESSLQLKTRLDKLALCKDSRAVESMPPPATGPERVEVERLQGELDTVETILLNDNLDDAESRANETLNVAQLRGYKAIEAEASVILADIQLRRTQFDKAHATLDSALVAAHSSRHLKAQALAEILRLRAFANQGRYEDAFAVNRLSQATLEGMGGATELDALRLSNLARVYLNRGAPGDFALAWEAQQRDLTLSIQLHGRDAPQVLSTLINLGVTAWNLGRYQDCVATFREAAQQLASLPGFRSKLFLGTVQENLGEALIRVGRPSEALSQIESGMALLTAYYGAKHPVAAYGHVLHSKALLALGQTQQALAETENALELYQSARFETDSTVLSARCTRGQGMFELRKFAAAEKELRDALQAFAQNVATEPFVEADCRLTLGKILAAKRQFGPARDQLQRSFELYERAASPDDTRRIPPQLALARIELTQHQTASAISRLSQALVVLEREGTWFEVISEARTLLAQARGQ